jgi:bifunctional non-homologous end joining protein LigD
VADAVAGQAPEGFTANMAKAKRAGKIFVDYVRNSRGATSVAPYSTRAKEHATVAVPLRWEELNGYIRPDTFTVKNLDTRLSQLDRDPWEGYFEVQQTQALDKGMGDALGPT